MRFDHTARVRRAISGIDSVEKRERRRYLKKKKTATRAHVPSPEILDDAPRALPRPSEPGPRFVSLFCFPLPPPPPPFTLLRTMYFTKCLDFSGRFVHALAERRDAKEIVSHDRENLLPNFPECHVKASEKLCCLWGIDKRDVRRDEKNNLFAKFVGWIKNMWFKRYAFCEGKY